MGKLQHKIKIAWSPKFAYAIGLITSDGYLHRDGRHIGFGSKDYELMEKFKQSLSLANKIGRSARGGETEKRYFHLFFGDKCFYRYLNSIGLTAAKSKTIKMVTVPDKYFADFLRGLFDGDGSFYTFWDKRWPKSFVFQMTFASASKMFIGWLKKRLNHLYGVKGVFHRGVGVYEIRYVKRDSVRLFQKMYHQGNLLFLTRKYNKIRNAIQFNAEVAQW